MIRTIIGDVLATYLLVLLGTCPAHAMGSTVTNEKPSAWFCFMARGAVASAGNEIAAESAARARGVSEATIAKAKRCPR